MTEVLQENSDSWMPVFTITPEDNAHFDKHIERMILTWLQQHTTRTTPHTHIDSNRLPQACFLPKKIEEADYEQQ